MRYLVLMYEDMEERAGLSVSEQALLEAAFRDSDAALRVMRRFVIERLVVLRRHRHRQHHSIGRGLGDRQRRQTGRTGAAATPRRADASGSRSERGHSGRRDHAAGPAWACRGVGVANIRVDCHPEGTRPPSANNGCSRIGKRWKSNNAGK